MQTLKKIGEGLLLGGIIFLLFLVVFEHKMHIPAWLQVAGRMHPMVLHFPIVLLLLSFISLWLPVNDYNREVFSTIRLIAAISGVITAIMGLLLSMEDDRSGNLLQLHKWGGISVAVFGFLFYSLQHFFAQQKITGRVFTIIASLAIVITGHYGADLTHGENYLLAPVKSNETRIVPVDQAIVFTDLIKPIFDKKCASCHGEASMKGGLILEDTVGILKGGKTGPLFIAGDPAMSLLMHRVHLPEEDKKHMPPISKTALTPDEITLLAAWIKSGALLNNKLTSLPAKDSFRILAARYLAPSESSPDQPVYDFKAADEKKIKELNNNYRIIEPQGIGSPALSVHFYGKNAYTKKSLEELSPLKQQIIELSLARMPVKDDDLSVVQQMTNLRKLNLNYTDITAKGLEQLSGLKKLQEVALSGTAVTAEALSKIAALPEMTSVFIWNTTIDSNAVLALQKKFKKVHLERGFVDNGELVVELGPPTIETPSGVFDNSRFVSLKHTLKGVEIRYTLDGTPVDSANSPVYKDSFAINNSTTLIARAFKKGWVGSVPVQSAYIKRGFMPDSIELLSPPDPKYTAPADKAGKLLSDGVLGETDFGSGLWLGYQKNEAAYNLYFTNTITTKQVLVNMLKSTAQSIFPPVKLQVWGGPDKTHLKLLGQITPAIPSKNEPAQPMQEIVSFAPANVKVLRVIAQPIKVLPGWHASKGKNGWVFVSEIVVD